MSSSYRIGFFADTHLGYSAYSFSDKNGINLRAKDGERALHTIINEMVAAEVDVVVHGGDIFHSSHPSIRDIYLFHHYMNELSRKGIPFYGLAGNHDASDNRSRMPAVAAVDDPDRNIHALWTPYQKYQLTDGIVLHSVAHHGLSGDAAPQVTADAGILNIFTTHGAALDPANHTLMNCKDSPREQIIPNEMIIDDSFILRLLGHYHSRYPVGGERLNTWYSGSTVRRGFSDDEGSRGWLLVEVNPDGQIKMTAKNIWQRPQHDLPLIDASGLSSVDVQSLISTHVEELTLDSLFDEDNAPIVRQKVINIPRSVRAGLDQKTLHSLTKPMLYWQLSASPPTESLDNSVPEEEQEETAGEVSLSHAAVNAVTSSEQFESWSKRSQTLAHISEERQVIVISEAKTHLSAARSDNS